MKFKKLNQSGQKKALDHLRDINTGGQWYKGILDTFKADCLQIGLSVNETSLLDLCSKDIGVSFSGTYTRLTNVSEDTLNPSFIVYLLRLNELLRDIPKTNKPYCSLIRDVSFGSDSSTMFLSKPLMVLPDYQSNLVLQVFRDIANYLHFSLLSEYARLTSDASVTATILANELDFVVPSEKSIFL